MDNRVGIFDTVEDDLEEDVLLVRNGVINGERTFCIGKSSLIKETIDRMIG